MDALGRGAAYGGWWWNRPAARKHRRVHSQHGKSCPPTGAGGGYNFPLKQALTAGSLALTGDTIAQLTDRHLKRSKNTPRRSGISHNFESEDSVKDVICNLISNHDWLRALRMTSYGFLFYGPGSFAWYQYLDHSLPKQTVGNIVMKIALNQIVLGPCVIAIVFAWNNLWLGKLSQLPKKYQEDALPTLLYGYRFWIPVSALNFWVVPLQARVAFMSMGSIFWNFCLSSSVSK